MVIFSESSRDFFKSASTMSSANFVIFLIFKTSITPYAEKKNKLSFENRTSEMSDYAKVQGITFIGDDDVINQVKYTIGCHDVSINDL